MDESHHAQPEHGLGATHGMPADHAAAAGRDHLGRAARNSRDHLIRHLRGKSSECQRERDSASHRIDVADGVGGGDRAVVVRIVEQRRKEVDGGDQCTLGIERIHRGIIERCEPDQHVGVRAARARRESGQHRHELGRRLGCAAAATGQRAQTRERRDVG